jgi:hypothetical protein
MDTAGAVTVIGVVSFALLLAFIGLSVDVGRIMNVHSQAGSYADRSALAAAAELDGEVGAMTRAVRAAAGDGTDGPIVETGMRLTLSGDNDVGLRRMTFLSALAADPLDPYARSPIAGDQVLCIWEPAGGFDCSASGLTVAEADKEAQFVVVDTTTETEQYLLYPIATFLDPDMRDEGSVAPQAVAGFKREVCNLPPLTICNPYENQTAPYGGTFDAVVGQQILMKTKGSGAAWAPGNFGFLRVPSGSGAPHCSGGGTTLLRCVLGLVTPNTQCVGADVDTEPGQAVAAHDGLNVRFDVYDPPLSSKRSDPAFAPAANVTKGKVNTAQCRSNTLQTPPPANNTVPLPRDTCFGSGTCVTTPDGSSRFGNGLTDAQRNAYWMTNHGAALPGSLLGATRFQMYRYEIDNNMIPNKSPTGENGNPTCSSQPPVNNPQRDRRVLIVAVINCLEHDVRGAATDVPVVKFAEIFLTEGVGFNGGSVEDVYVEVLGVVEPNGEDGILKEYPVLYR